MASLDIRLFIALATLSHGHCDGLISTGCQMPTKLFSKLFPLGQGKKIRPKKDRDISHKHERFKFVKINLIHCQLKIE